MVKEVPLSPGWQVRGTCAWQDQALGVQGCAPKYKHTELTCEPQGRETASKTASKPEENGSVGAFSSLKGLSRTEN